ncbi:hypothetical protein KR093_006606 [Drosophila rubida]|uniref:Uncharacterized protein n=1 Tax=Drosophila rubida TaxID=30044 RepID=A0AAD4KDH3_9MUSC|nr:hypothetical protein KR093_006606 [Drosophila rubida]
MFECEPLPDSEDKLIERLGDCNVPVDYMDLLSHRIRCHKIEIFHYDDEVSFTPHDEEEEQELSYGELISIDHTDDEDRLEALVKSLDCLLRRIDQMQLRVKERQHEREERTESGVTEASTEQLKMKKSEPKQVLLSCVEQLEVRNLQHDQHHLQCEINTMLANYRLLRQVLATLRDQMCAENRNCSKLGANVLHYHKWCEDVASELTVCQHRYQTLLATKLTKSEATRVIRANTAKARRRQGTFLSLHRLNFDRQEFDAEIDELLEYASDLRKEMARRFDYPPQRASNMEESTACNDEHADSLLEHEHGHYEEQEEQQEEEDDEEVDTSYTED